MATKKKRTATRIKVKATEAKQGSWSIFCFVMNSKTLDDIAFVSRREDDKAEGYQRNLSRQRAADIARYLDKEGGCIPNSILLNLEPGAKYDRKTNLLTIPNKPKSAWVIDGQHRMFGLQQSNRTYDIVVTAFLGLEIAVQAKQFKIINSKQKGVPTSLLYDLLDLTKDGTFVQQRGHELAALLNNEPESPFYGQIDMTGGGDGLITQTRVVTALESLISDRGALFQYTEEEQYGILRNYFAAVKSLLPSDWGNKKSILTKAIGFSALLIILPQVLTLTVQRHHDFRTESAKDALTPIASYNFSAEAHKGWAGHPGENRLAGALADRLKSAQTSGTAGSQNLRLK
jgi:DGQHR domain-containing protein